MYIYYFSLLRGRGALLETWRVTYGLQATGYESLIYTHSYMHAYKNV